MTGGSVITPVDGGSTACDQLDLCVADLAKFLIKISDLVVFEIQFHIQVKKVNDLLWYQAQRPMNINAAMQRQRIGVFIAYGIC